MKNLRSYYSIFPNCLPEGEYDVAKRNIVWGQPYQALLDLPPEDPRVAREEAKHQSLTVDAK